MTVEVDFGDISETEDASLPEDKRDPDEFLAQNAFRIVYQTNNFLLPQIRDMVERREAINLHPEYQRRLRWTPTQKSRLIESLLLNIPVPPVFFYESEAARYEVMDGQQRLNTINDFFSGDFALSGLKVLTPLNGLRYPRASPRVKRTLDRANLSAIILLLESESERPSQGKLSLTDIRRLVFDRLNTGGMKLNPQELRNAQNPGPFNETIVALSRYDLFTDVFGIPPYIEDNPEDYYVNPERQKNTLYKNMADCELVLRYFALRDSGNIRGSMRSMLDRAMEVKISQDQAIESQKNYKSRFSFLYELFDSNPFVLRSDGKERVSAAVYDAAMVAADQLWERRNQIAADKNGVKQRMLSASADEDKYEILVGRGNTADSVRERIDLMKNILFPE
ncbi:MAG: DUF262 domain-containing protein [Pseudomonadota bacterium]|nr:DUF262 domain-containing protein [Pseudomonadota bacterium]